MPDENALSTRYFKHDSTLAPLFCRPLSTKKQKFWPSKHT